MITGAIQGKVRHLAAEKPWLFNLTHENLRVLIEVFMQ
jgi:hypothetical protein